MGITSADFIGSAIADLGVTVVRTPVTATINNVTGEKEYTDGTNANIVVVFENTNKKYTFDKAGMTEGADARLFMKSTDTLNKNDKVTYSGITYRVDSVSDRKAATNLIYQVVLLFEITN